MKGEYNDLLTDFDSIVAMEKDCYKLNKNYLEQSKNSVDLMKKMNKNNNSTFSKKELVVIILISTIAAGFIAGTVSGVGVRYRK